MIDYPNGENFYRVWLKTDGNLEEEERAGFYTYHLAQQFLSLAVQGMYGVRAGSVRFHTGKVLRKAETDGTWYRETNPNLKEYR